MSKKQEHVEIGKSIAQEGTARILKDQISRVVGVPENLVAAVKATSMLGIRNEVKEPKLSIKNKMLNYVSTSDRAEEARVRAGAQKPPANLLEHGREVTDKMILSLSAKASSTVRSPPEATPQQKANKGKGVGVV